jgi:hypothetical protein
MEWLIIWFFILLSIVSFFIWLPKQPIKEWLLIFFIHVVIVTYTDAFFVSYQLLEYPIRLFPHVFEINVLFDLLVCPTLAVFYNQTSYYSSSLGMIGQLTLYILPFALMEGWLEKSTELISFYQWSWFHSFLTLYIPFLLVRFGMSLIRHYSI